MYKFVSLLISEVMFLFSGSTSCLFIIALAGFLIWILFFFHRCFVCASLLGLATIWALDDLVIAVGAAKRFCVWCWFLTFISLSVCLYRIAFRLLHTNTHIRTMILSVSRWWHLMCHVVHYHYQHVLLGSRGFSYSADLLPTSVFLCLNFDGVSFGRVTHSHTHTNVLNSSAHSLISLFKRKIVDTLHNSHKWCQREIIP